MRRVGGKDRVPLDDMPKLRHLKWVVKETLRCTRSCHTCCPGREPPAHHHLQLRCADGGRAIGRDPTSGWEDHRSRTSHQHRATIAIEYINKQAFTPRCS